MTRRSILEYAQALRSRYFGASRTEKGKMLDEFTQVTGLRRKAAIRLLHRPVQPGRQANTCLPLSLAFRIARSKE